MLNLPEEFTVDAIIAFLIDLLLDNLLAFFEAFLDLSFIGRLIG